MTYSSHGVPTATRDIYREAIDEALKRCIPLHFSAGMAGAVAGRPIAIRFVEDAEVTRKTAQRARLLDTLGRSYRAFEKHWSLGLWSL